MKHLFAALLAVLVGIALATLVRAGEPAAKEPEFDLSRSLLKNPTLVAGQPDAHGVPQGWGATVDWKKDQLSTLRIEKDDQVLFQGRPSTRVTFGPMEKPTWWQLMQNIRWTEHDLRGKKVRLTYHIRRDQPYPEGERRDFICVGRLPKEDPKTRERVYARPVAFQVAQVTEPGDWQRVVVEGKVDDEASFFNFTVQNDGRQSRFWLSGFLLEVIE